MRETDIDVWLNKYIKLNFYFAILKINYKCFHTSGVLGFLQAIWAKVAGYVCATFGAECENLAAFSHLVAFDIVIATFLWYWILFMSAESVEFLIEIC